MSAPTATAKSRETRWQEEAAFFDDVARRTDPATLPIDPSTLERYSRRVLRKRFNKEWRFRILGPLQGKTILDVGCGDGVNAAMFAKMGARVTGVDVSAKALEVARLRAEANAVSDRVSLVCGPIEAAGLAPDSFDIIWADNILHHVLDDLDLVMSELVRWAKPDGLLLLCEPVNLFPPLRRLRQMIPVPMEGTPGERPLVAGELRRLRRYLLDSRVRHYSLLGRVDRFILVSNNYERSPATRRAIVNCIDLLDYALLSLPWVTNLASFCVAWGHPNKGASRHTVGAPR